MGTTSRPVWTACFGFVWIALAISTFFCHIALMRLIPAVEDFPSNLEKGFESVLGFGKLETEIAHVEAAADHVLAACGIGFSSCPAVLQAEDSAMSQCRSMPPFDSSAEKLTILQAFENGLAKIEKVGNDKYFGIDALARVGTLLDEVKSSLDAVPDNADCCTQSTAFCSIRDEAANIEHQTKDVQKQIIGITQNQAVGDYYDNAGLLFYLHALPYLMVISTSCFTMLWFKNGTCCCQKGGSLLDCCVLILFQVFFALLVFIIMSMIVAVGYGLQHLLVDVKIPSQDPPILRGTPKVYELLDHVQSQFPEFWKYVFSGVVEGLMLLRLAAATFVGTSLVVVGYSCAFCCVRPYDARMPTHAAPRRVNGVKLTTQDSRV